MCHADKIQQCDGEQLEICHADKTQQCDGEQLGGYFRINR